MEPKSIAFYTAVAVSILAVISATTFPTLVQAQTTPDEEQEDNAATTESTAEANANTEEDNAATTEDKTEPPKEDGQDDSSQSNDDSDEVGSQSQSLGLNPLSGVASCGQLVTADLKLTSDLECGTGDGLIVGASN